MRTERPKEGGEFFTSYLMPFLHIVELYYSECIIFLSLIIKDLERQEELRTAQMNMKEHQETISKLRGIVSGKIDEISNIQMNLENANTALKAPVFLSFFLFFFFNFL